jgi:hypothetical protein
MQNFGRLRCVKKISKHASQTSRPCPFKDLKKEKVVEIYCFEMYLKYLK